MFNTFGNDPNDPFQANKIKMREKDKIIELTNLSTIQLNPWGDELSKSPIYDEHQCLTFFPKPSVKTSSTLIPYMLPKEPLKKSNVSINQKKRQQFFEIRRKQNIINKRKNKQIQRQERIKSMNKTISVHNFQGQTMLRQFDSIQRKQKTVYNEPKKSRTLINNPMYGRFCSVQNTQKTPVLKKRNLTANVNITQFLSQKQVQLIRTKMSGFGLSKGDPQRAKSIHEVRRRLRSTCELSKKQQESLSQKNQTVELKEKQNMFTAFKKSENRQEQVKSSNKTKISMKNKSSIQSVEIEVQKFKPTRKNLYIGYRKFFNPAVQTIGLRQKNASGLKQIQKRQVISFNNLDSIGQMEIVRKFSRLDNVQT